jgi:hypothetical protein
MGGKPLTCKPPCLKVITPRGPECYCSETESLTLPSPAPEECMPPCYMKSDIMGDPAACQCPGSMEYFGGRRRSREEENDVNFPLAGWLLLGGVILIACYFIKSKGSRR